MSDQTDIPRGTDFVDGTVRDIRCALRGFKRAPVVAFTIVSTVALGLGLSSLFSVAASIPAARAARLNPTRALRQG